MAELRADISRQLLQANNNNNNNNNGGSVVLQLSYNFQHAIGTYWLTMCLPTSAGFGFGANNNNNNNNGRKLSQANNNNNNNNNGGSAMLQISYQFQRAIGTC